ncbi:hypothetical protein AgCh_012552 [Apium graveolens]
MCTSDIALDVASEMVKELEITDWDSTDIAKMISEEIFALLPDWKESNLTQNLHHQQQSFNYNDNDDEDGIIHHLLYSPSSQNSSHASLPGLFTSTHDWPQDTKLNRLVDKMGVRMLAVLTKSDKAPDGLHEKVVADDMKIGLASFIQKCSV